MNKQIRRLGVFMVLLYAAVFVKLNQVQVFEAPRYEEDPLNSRIAQREYDRPRGSILSVDGTVLAESIPASGDSQFKLVRQYPQGDLFGQITGYLSFRFGSSGMEKSYNDELTGQTLRQQAEGFNPFSGVTSQVGDVYITVHKEVQETARTALAFNTSGQSEGSVVALDPRTGEILAFWSSPSFDPNLISGAEPKQEEINAALLNLAPGKPLLAKQYQELYPPGSTFKVVTGSTGLDTGKVTNDQPVYPVRTAYLPPQTRTPIGNFGGSACGGSLPAIIEVSCNSAFAEMGQATIGADDMVRGAEAFGFNKDVPIDLPAPAKSNFPIDVKDNPPKLAQASIGQNDVTATPLQIAMMSAAVANQGKIMKPHVMREVRRRPTKEDPAGSVIKSYPVDATWTDAMGAPAANTIKEDMYGVVERGSGTNARIPGVAVGGKTGTAQIGDTGRLNTWFTAFAGPPGQPPTVAIAVVVLNVENGGNERTGGAIAAPIARTVMEKILAVQQRAGSKPRDIKIFAPGGRPTRSAFSEPEIEFPLPGRVGTSRR